VSYAESVYNGSTTDGGGGHYGIFCARAKDRVCALNMSMLEVNVTDAQGKPANVC